MPYLKLTTNKTINRKQSPQLLAQFSQLLATETGKPERFVMIELTDDSDMLFSGTTASLAYIECKSIGLTSSQAKSLSSSISKILSAELDIPADRVYIEFSNCPAEFWGWDGSTFG